MSIGLLVALFVAVLPSGTSEAQEPELFAELPTEVTLYDGTNHIAYLGKTFSVREALTNVVDDVTGV